MNAPYDAINAMANRICGLKPTYRKPAGIFTKVTYRGLDLYVGIDCYGDVESVAADSDGTDVTEIFRDWNDEILMAIDKQQGEAQ